METQTITQTLNIVVGGNTAGGGNLADTGSSIKLLPIIALVLIITSILAWYLASRRSSRYKLHTRSLGIFTVLVFTALGLGINTNLLKVSATPTLTLGVDQNNLNITVPKGGGTATTTTSLTTRTQNPSGYKLTAQLTAPEPGIAIALKGGAVTTSIPLTANASPLELKTTTTSTASDTIDTTDLTLTFTIDGTVTPGTKELKLNYQITDNEPSAPVIPTTMQSMTSAYCSTMEVYDGTNEEAVLTLTDARANNQTYQVAKLADNKCWMLNNLKLGSTSAATLLTPQDTDIASDFTLPQLTTTGTADPDNPGAYGPVPGDTNSGATNYGYLYNWSAATAGESRTTHDQNAGDAPYSICPANWRLPTSGADGDFASLDITFGGTGQYASSGEPNIAKWQNTGPFKGIFSGYWGGFDDQGGYGYLWASSANPGNAGYAMFAGFNADGVYPFSYDYRSVGVGVRCLLNIN